MIEQVEIHEPFRDARQRHAADMMGMYVFLTSEIMLFGGLFLVIYVVRTLHPHEVVQASKQMHVFIGAINTAVLLTSSLLVALAVHAARSAMLRRVVLLLTGTTGLGLVFLGLKAFEYYWEYRDGLLPAVSDPERFSVPVERLFMNIYFVATGLHALHVAVGTALLGGLAIRLRRDAIELPERAVVVEVCGLYWHLVDVIWVFLYPALYLAR